MTPPLRVICFGALVAAHATLTFFAAFWCMGVSMALLEGGHTQAPSSLSAVCWLGVGLGMPLAYPLSALMYDSSSLNPQEPLFCLLVPINSLVTIWVIYFIIGVLKKLRSTRSGPEHEKA
jgi:hypothetical protein